MFWPILLMSVQLFAAAHDEIFPSSAEDIASLRGEILVEGFVSPLSGQAMLSETDLEVRGAQNVSLKRTYHSPRVFGSYDEKEALDHFHLASALIGQRKGWFFLSHLWASCNLRSSYFQLPDPQGFVLEFEIEGDQGVLRTPPYGCSNFSEGRPSAAADLRNIEFGVKGDEIEVVWPDGVKRIYKKQQAKFYRLESERLPNGKAIRYEYDDQGLVRIFSSDWSGKYTYASISKTEENQYIGSDLREVRYDFTKKEIKGKSKKEGMLKVEISLLREASNPTYSNTAEYSERTLITAYDAKEYPVSFAYSRVKGALSRVEQLSTPSGTIRFSYDPPIAGEKGGFTIAVYPNDKEVVYRFDRNLLLIAIENCLHGKLVNQKLFSYDQKQRLSKVETRDGVGQLLIARHFECDDFGNPLLERLEGDFGTFSIRREFVKNRIVKEERDDGLSIEIAYLGTTSLPVSKTVLEWGKPLRQTAYLYDEAYNLIEESEAGGGKILYTLYDEGPHLHRVEWKEERDSQRRLVRKIRYFYDEWGNCREEQHYGSTALLEYAIKRTYDRSGNLLEETNPLGQTASYQYDLRGRCIREIPFSNRLAIRREFDAKGRLICQDEGGHIASFVYNDSGELIEKTDYLGLKTSCVYDPIHGKPIRIEEEPTLLQFSYDSFGREIERKDAYGAATKTRFDSAGHPVETFHPDGGIETWSYAPNGLLIEHTDPDGLKTRYTHDALGRMTSKTVGGLATFFTYDARRLLEVLDPAGIKTRFRYDAAGRKVEEERGGRVSHFGYDALGFLAFEERGRRRISFRNDVLGRVLEKTDGLSTTVWEYDAAGNIARADSTEFLYDPFGRLIEKTDGEGAKTFIRYEEGDRLLRKRIQDPNGIEMNWTYLPQGPLLKREVEGRAVEEFQYDRALRPVAQDHLTFSYTPEGRKASMTEAGRRTTFWTYTPAGKIQTQTKQDGTLLHYEYDAQGRLAKISGAQNAGSQFERFGSNKTPRLLVGKRDSGPDFAPQDVLPPTSWERSLKDRLEALRPRMEPVGTIREFKYDSLDRLIAGTGFERTLDSFGNILREQFANGLSIETSYDDWDQPLLRTLPGGSQILYEYEGPFLKKVVRLDAFGDALYSHAYDQYDSGGRLLSETGLFPAEYRYDKAGRKVSQECPYFKEALAYDPAGRLIQSGDVFYAYDALSQLEAETGRFTSRCDAHYRLLELDGHPLSLDPLGKIEWLPYDLNGNLLRSRFAYDAFDRLVRTPGQEHTYDALGRRLRKNNVAYLYCGEEEIGAFENGMARELKIPGAFGPAAIEIDGKPYAPVKDVQGTIRYLVDWSSKEIAFRNPSDAFGAGTSGDLPYAYAGKRFDADTKLFYFGQRFYDPLLHRWISPDPLGPIDHSNLYQYVFNNPFVYAPKE